MPLPNHMFRKGVTSKTADKIHRTDDFRDSPDKMNKRPKRLSNPRPQIKQAWDIIHESIIPRRVHYKWTLLCSYFLSCERVQLQSTFIIVTRASARQLRILVRGTGNKKISRYQPSVNRYSLSIEKVSFINVFQQE